MIEFLFDYGLFAAKLATFVIAILVVVVVSVGAGPFKYAGNSLGVMALVAGIRGRSVVIHGHCPRRTSGRGV